MSNTPLRSIKTLIFAESILSRKTLSINGLYLVKIVTKKYKNGKLIMVDIWRKKKIKKRPKTQITFYASFNKECMTSRVRTWEN